jgi:hypothetical protein
MGFIHHTTGATGATGLMAGYVRPQGIVMCEHPGLLATDLPGRLAAPRSSTATSTICSAGATLSTDSRPSTITPTRRV